MADQLELYLRPRPRYGRQLWLVVALLLGATGWVGWIAYQDFEQAELLNERTDRIKVAQAATAAPRSSKLENEESKKWAVLKAERSFAWEPLFLAVERATNTEIELLEFQPDKGSHSVSLRGEARNHQALVAFLTALAAQSALHDVHLVHEQGVVRNRLETVSFEIKATIAGT